MFGIRSLSGGLLLFRLVLNFADVLTFSKIVVSLLRNQMRLFDSSFGHGFDSRHLHNSTLLLYANRSR